MEGALALGKPDAKREFQCSHASHESKTDLPCTTSPAQAVRLDYP